MAHTAHYFSEAGIIGGSGWLGRSIARSMLNRSFLTPERLILSGRTRSPALADWPTVRIASSNQELVDAADVVLLSVRPDDFPSVQISAPDKLVISVMAAVSARTIGTRTGAQRIVRALPNAAVEIERSYTPWFAAANLARSDKDMVQGLFETCGSADEVQLESDIDYCTGLTGSGPAFPALLAQAMMQHATARGISPDTARRAANGVIVGASALITQPGRSADEIIELMMGYRGTTAAALQAMIAGGFVEAVHAGLTEAEKAVDVMAKKSTV